MASQPFGVLTEKQLDGTEALVRERTGNRSLVLFDTGDEVTVRGHPVITSFERGSSGVTIIAQENFSTVQFFRLLTRIH